jgi:hypothetical protein
MNGRMRAPSVHIPVTDPPAALAKHGSSSAMWRYAFALSHAHSALYDDCSRSDSYDRITMTGIGIGNKSRRKI